MKAIMIMFDSLNRNYLSPYGGIPDITPNFSRLSERTVTFECCYAGSLPCIPARREIHTGRYNFLHRSWGPVEPYDDSAMEILKKHDVYTHLVSDHFHYWEDGGATYHTRYNSWEIIRGEQVDPWKIDLNNMEVPESLNNYTPRVRIHDVMNRRFIQQESDMPQAKTFRTGLEFLKTNHTADNWFLHLEAFDPHEPFVVPDRFYEKIGKKKPAIHYDWPEYGKVKETPEQMEACRTNYEALLAMSDEYLGTILDFMDEQDMWDDTMLIVNTDHGFFLGEKDWWGKVVMPYYDEIARIPFFVWDPRSGKRGGRNGELVQTIDIAPTLLDYFGLEPTADMEGKPLRSVIDGSGKGHDAVLFGSFGAHVNCTDGKHVLMKGPVGDNTPLYNYTMIPTNMRGFFSNEELNSITLSDPFPFTKGSPLMRADAKPFQQVDAKAFGDILFDIEEDPEQLHPIRDGIIEAQMVKKLTDLMKHNDAPEEQFARLGL